MIFETPNSSENSQDPENANAAKASASTTGIAVGKIRDSHGLKGELYAILFAGESSWLGRTQEILLARNEKDAEGNLVEVNHPFQIRSAKPHKVGLILRLQGFTDRNQSDEFKGAILKVEEKVLTSKPGEVIYLREIEGFEVSNRDEVVGPIVGFSSNRAQDLIVVETSKGRFEVPLVREFIEKIDWSGRKIKMNLPVGLLGEEA